MESDTYALVKSSIKKLLAIDLDYYKDEQMKRRLDSWLVRSQRSSWRDYFQYVASNPEEQQRLRDYLTINVTEFFRDPERWATLKRDVLPALLEQSPVGLRVWSAGCSTGVEAYTLAILLDEVAPHRKHWILATDIDRGALQKARAGGPYSADEIRNLTPQQRARYIDSKAQNYVRAELVQRVTFREQDLFTERFESGFDLIVCRNVVIYFTNDAKTMLYRKFQTALRPGGVLFLGGTEIIPHPAEVGLQNFGISFYRKIGG